MNKRLTYQDQCVYVYYVKQEKSQESNDTTTDPKQEDADVYEIVNDFMHLFLLKYYNFFCYFFISPYLNGKKSLIVIL